MDYTSPHWDRSVLLTIDTQNDFTWPGAPAEIAGTTDVLPQMQALLKLYRERGWPIIHVVRLYKEDGSNVDVCRRARIEAGARIAVPHSEGAELVEPIRPVPITALDAAQLLAGAFQAIGPNEWAMYKPRWGAFYGTALEMFLRERELDTTVFIGCNFPNCPRTSIYEASERDFRIVLVADAMSQVYDQGLAEMRNIGVQVCRTDELVAMFGS